MTYENGIFLFIGATSSVLCLFLEYLRPYLNHSFKNVRERLGSILINIFEADLQFVDAPEPECPRIKDIIHEVVQKIQVLKLDEPKNNGRF